jgi:hypothetical protein
MSQVIADVLRLRLTRLKHGLEKAYQEHDENEAHELRLEIQQTMDAINFETLP